VHRCYLRDRNRAREIFNLIIFSMLDWSFYQSTLWEMCWKHCSLYA